MKKLLLILCLFLTGCTSAESEVEPVVEKTFEETIEEFLIENGYTEVTRVSNEDIVVGFTSDSEYGLVQFIEGEDPIVESLPVDGEDFELLHIGYGPVTYFGIIFRSEELFNQSSNIVIDLMLSDEPVEFDLSGEFQPVMVQLIEKSLTSCAAEEINIYNGSEVIYSESFIPT